VEVWVKGVSLDWGVLYGGSRPRRVGLPGYPFAQERYWIERTSAGGSAGGSSGAAVLHPLVHTNVSDLAQQRYRTTFSGQEWCLTDHRVAGALALPWSGLVELLRAAVVAAQPAPWGGTIELQALQCVSPLTVEAGEVWEIALALEGARIGYEVYRGSGEAAPVVAQGWATFVETAASSLALAPLRARLGPVEAPSARAGSAMQVQYGPAFASVTWLQRGRDEGLVGLRLPEALLRDASAYGLHPGVLEGVVQGVEALFGPSTLWRPVAAEAVRVYGPSSAEAVAWVRRHAEAGEGAMRLDVRVADTAGAVWCDIQGWAWAPMAIAAAPATATPAQTALPRVEGQAPVSAPLPTLPVIESSSLTSTPPMSAEPVWAPQALSFLAGDEAAIEAPTFPAARASTGRRVLASPMAVSGVAASLQRRAPLVLRPAGVSGSAMPARSASPVVLEDGGEGLFVLRVREDGAPLALAQRIDHLCQALAFASRQSEGKVLLWQVPGAGFLDGGAAAHQAAIAAGLYRALVACPMPTIAVMRGHQAGVGALCGALCDLRIAATSATYGYGEDDRVATVAEHALWTTRFGPVLAERWSTGAVLDGAQVRALGGTWAQVPAETLEAQARGLAAGLQSKPVLALRVLKAHLSREVAAQVAGWAPVEVAVPLDEALDAGPASHLASTKWVEVVASTAGVQVLRLRTGRKATSAAVRRELATMLAAAVKAGVRAVVLASAWADYLPGEVTAAEAAQWQALLTQAALPVVAALEQSVQGRGWAVALACTGCVHAAEGLYGVAGFTPEAEEARWVQMVFAQRFGAAGQRWPLEHARQTGAQLAQALGARAVPAAEVLVQAQALAAQWARRPAAAWAVWQRQQASAWREALAAIPRIDEAQWEALDAVEGVTVHAGPVALHSAVVTLTVSAQGVAWVRMAERSAQNMFTEALIAGVAEAFAWIAQSRACKVVVVSGYDRYFASGGTKASLLAIQSGQAQFTDYRLFEVALACELPVIAAMQGHGIGAGWTLGMFADVVLASAESRYVSPYMDYGFTPGAGATWVLAEKLGGDVAWEGLLTAQALSGAQLAARGARVSVWPRSRVEAEAEQVAAHWAVHSRARLRAWKARTAASVRARIGEVYAAELAMHAQTFVGQAQALARIEAKFAAEQAAVTGSIEAPAEKPAAIAAIPASAPASAAPRVAPGGARSGAAMAGAVEASAVHAALRELLAQELQLSATELDPETQFVDLGLDSISGVTWVRKINQRYGTAIEATKVYSHPTLTQFGRLVLEEISKTQTKTPSAPEAIEPAIPVRPHATALATRALEQTEVSLRSTLRELLAQELQLSATELDPETQFVDLGLDSISGVTWVRKINQRYGTAIEATKVYSHPTLTQFGRLVLHEVQQLGGLPDSAPSSDTIATTTIEAEHPSPVVTPSTGLVARLRGGSRTQHATGTTLEPIAVIGMAGRFPQAPTLEAFWRNIAEGRNCIDVVPRERWNIDDYYQPGDAVPGKTNSRWQGTLDDADQFDPLFFNISPIEAESMDPQQRLFMQACWHGIEDAGYDARSLSGSRCGVFVGCTASDYYQQSLDHQLTAQGFTGGAISILAARIAYFLNLQGPCLSIDTACSSSLVAIAQACDSLVAGTSDLALAGGVFVMAGPEMHIKTAQAGMLSPDGRCFTFDHRANGFVPGEGVGMVVLKRLADAERDGDRICGVLRGWGVNQDGKTNGITAPNPESQTRLEREVYQRFAIDPAAIQLIEAHGTGTQLGDPIEIDALKQTFATSTAGPASCALGSVKSNIGHCLTAAGIAGTLKLLLALQHRQLPPTIHFERLNPHIGLDDSPFYVNDRLRSWDTSAGQPRVAAVSSFGFSGTNAHLVIGEYAAGAPEVPVAEVLSEDGKWIVPLSARTAEQLRQKVVDLLAFLEREGGSVGLLDLAYTLQVGREAMEERLGFLVSTTAQLIERLRDYLEDVAAGTDLRRGNAKNQRKELGVLADDGALRLSVLNACIANREVAKLLDLWVKGLDFDWHKLYGQTRPQRIRLPGYPFANERYWLAPSNRSMAVAGWPGERLFSPGHPLLHANTSSFDEQRYSACFNGEESFLADHRVRIMDAAGQKTLPAVAYLEMARAATASALPDRLESSRIEIRNAVWIRPFIAEGDEKSLHISLLPGNGDAIDYEVHSGNEECPIVHGRGEIVFTPERKREKIDIDALRRRMDANAMDSQTIYRTFAGMGLDYGPAHRPLRAIFRGHHEAIADLEMPESVVLASRDYLLHPSMLDGALQASLGVAFEPGRMPDKPSLPFSLDKLNILSGCPAVAMAWVRLSPGASLTDRLVKLDIDLCTTDGDVCLEFRGFAMRSLETATREDNAVRGAAVADFDLDRYRRIIEGIAEQRVSIDEALALE
jgi:acyl transferase domain-containing protein/enoyl-CoA hydratase/carnithine racemase/aryl carrier-like protein